MSVPPDHAEKVSWKKTLWITVSRGCLGNDFKTERRTRLYKFLKVEEVSGLKMIPDKKQCHYNSRTEAGKAAGVD